MARLLQPSLIAPRVRRGARMAAGQDVATQGSLLRRTRAHDRGAMEDAMGVMGVRDISQVSQTPPAGLLDQPTATSYTPRRKRDVAPVLAYHQDAHVHARPHRAHRKHLTQDERSAAAQEQILDAVLKCLFRGGYACVTTVEVARAARLSRGALQHHYRNLDTMVAAAIRHLFERYARELATAVAGIETDRTFNRAVSTMWVVFGGRFFPVWTQLLAAGRNEPRLREVLKNAEKEFCSAIEKTLHEALPIDEDAKLPIPALIAALLGVSCQENFFAEICPGGVCSDQLIDAVFAIARLHAASQPGGASEEAIEAPLA